MTLLTALVALTALATGCSQALACSCVLPPPLDVQVRTAFDEQALIALVQIIRTERRSASLAFTAEHLLGEVSQIGRASCRERV